MDCWNLGPCSSTKRWEFVISQGVNFPKLLDPTATKPPQAVMFFWGIPCGALKNMEKHPNEQATMSGCILMSAAKRDQKLPSSIVNYPILYPSCFKHGRAHNSIEDLRHACSMLKIWDAAVDLLAIGEKIYVKSRTIDRPFQWMSLSNSLQEYIGNEWKRWEITCSIKFWHSTQVNQSVKPPKQGHK